MSEQPISAYKDGFLAFCQEFQPRISTGIKDFDIALHGGLVNEFYILGAETSTGKSAFLMTIAQNIAAAGIDVLYFALEMGRNEFIARGISSISFEHKKISVSDILYWNYDEKTDAFKKLPFTQYESYLNEYFRRYGEHLYIIEGGTSGLSVEEIAEKAYQHKLHTKKPVVVCIDYLQITRQNNLSTDRKTKTDIVTTTLKSLASQVGMPVIALSSVSRNTYNENVNISAYKESGDTEYTGGVLLGWNWEGVTNQPDLAKKRQEIKECKKRGYRRITLEILKYRNAERDASVNLRYYPAYSHFESEEKLVTNAVIRA